MCEHINLLNIFFRHCDELLIMQCMSFLQVFRLLHDGRNCQCCVWYAGGLSEQSRRPLCAPGFQILRFYLLQTHHDIPLYVQPPHLEHNPGQHLFLSWTAWKVLPTDDNVKLFIMLILWLAYLLSEWEEKVKFSNCVPFFLGLL